MRLGKKYGIIALYFLSCSKSLSALKKITYESDVALGTVVGPNSGMTSKTATGQHREARVEQAKATALPEKSNHSFANSRYGLFPTRPAIDQQQVMQEAASFLVQEKPKAVNFEPKNTVENMIKHAAGNFMKNTIVTEVTPVIKSAGELANLNLKFGLIAVTGGGAKLGYEAMSVGSRVIAGKALIGGTQGVFGAWATGSDLIDTGWSGLFGAGLGTLNLSNYSPIKLSEISKSALSSGISNFGGQLVSKYRNPSQTHFNPIALGFSMWGGCISEYLTGEITVPLSKAIIESTIQNPISGIGSHLGAWK